MQILERQEQLETLKQCLTEAHAGSGKLVLVAGEAGIGKSSLVESFVSEHRRNARTLWGGCDGLTTPRPLTPVHEIAAQMAGLSNRLASGEKSRERLFRVLLEDLARPNIVSIVVLEDLHWADAATLDFLRFIGKRIQRTSAVLIVTYRDDDLDPTGPMRLALGELTSDHVVRFRLQPLSLAAVKRLAGTSGRDAQLVHQTTGGNPLFVREVLASPSELVPRTVRDTVLARLARCSARTRELAELVAVSPERTPTWLIGAALGRCQESLDEAGSRGLLDADSDSVRFRHELARLAVASAIPFDRARLLHARVLRVLLDHHADPARLVHHALLAEAANVVVEFAPLAAAEAALLGAHREAAAHLAAALRHGPSLPVQRRTLLLEQHARESSLANQTHEAIESATAALAAFQNVGDVEGQSRVLCALSQEYRTLGDKARADDAVLSAISLLESVPRGASLAMAYGWRSQLAVHRGRDVEALDFGQRALDLAREVGDPAAESLALCSIGGALLGTGDRSGYAPLERSLELALTHRLEEHAARAYRTLLFYCVLIHDFVRAQGVFQEGVEYCEERGIFSHCAYMRAYFTVCELDRGHWTDAARTATELLERASVVGVQQRVTVMTTVGLVRVRRGDPGADELLDEALRLALPTSELNRIGRVAAARAELAWYRGESSRVASEAAAGLAAVGGHNAPWIHGELMYWGSRVATVDWQIENVAEPYRLALQGKWRAAAGMWAELGMPYEQALALADGPEEALREALAILNRLGAGPLAAIVRKRLLELGARRIPRGPRRATRGNAARLTAKELVVLRLLAQGYTNIQLARHLHRSPRTIDHHVSAILRKLRVQSRRQAIEMAVARGIVTPDARASAVNPAE